METILQFWNIIGADGHPIQGEFSFHRRLFQDLKCRLKLKMTHIHRMQAKMEHLWEDVEDTKTNEQSQLPSYLIPVIVIGLVAIIVGIFVGLRRKNSK